MLTSRKAIYNVISPGWFVTPVYGNNHFTFESALYWFSLPITILLSLLARYIYKSVRMGYFPDDVDIIRYHRKFNPGAELRQEPSDENVYLGQSSTRRPESAASRSMRRTDSIASSLPPHGRPSMADLRSGSRTDMSTGVTSQHRGFDFSMEERGVAIQRMQTNLSERRMSSRHLPEPAPTKSKLAQKLTLPRSFMRRKSNAAATQPTGSQQPPS